MVPRNLDLIKFLTPDELTRLIGSIANKRDRAIFLIAYRHGLRAGEVGLLQDPDQRGLAARCNFNGLRSSQRKSTRCVIIGALHQPRRGGDAKKHEWSKS